MNVVLEIVTSIVSGLVVALVIGVIAGMVAEDRFDMLPWRNRHRQKRKKK